MTSPLRVLLVEDSPTDAKLVLVALQGTGRPVDHLRVETPEDMRAALAAREWDLVLTDWSMPRFSALGALGVLKESGLDLPIIIVSGTIGEETAVDAMRAGAHDYVLKDRLKRLAPAVERELREAAARAEQRRASEARRVSEARFKSLWDSGIILITVCDMAGRFLEVNDCVVRVLGRSREELLDGDLLIDDITPPDWRAADQAALTELGLRGVATPWEKELLRKDGSRVPILAGAAVLEGTLLMGIALDLSDRKQAEAALHRTEEQLRQAQKMEAVGRLAGGVAHDFNNVLSVILSYADFLLQDLAEGDPKRADVLEIGNAATRAANLTRQLLLFSRQKVMEPRVVDINAALLGIDKMLRRILGEDVELVSRAAGAIGSVRIDPSSFEQLAMNLVVNARDAMPTGGTLVLETANVVLDEQFAREHLGARAGPHVMFSVTDTGTGMAPETLAHIFEPFFTTKDRGKGTGLGLSTVFGIVQQCGGVLSVVSEPGAGTTFTAYFPRAEAPPDAPHATSMAPSSRGSETVLLVEDDPQVRAVVRGILVRSGYVVLDAGHPGEALLLAEQHRGPIALLLSDVVMPQMSGPELAKRLTATRPEMRVLCMSGYTDDSIIRHGVVDAELAFIQKPVTPQILTRKVREVLEGRD